MLPHDVVRIAHAELVLAITEMMEAKTEDKLSEAAEVAEQSLEALQSGLQNCLHE